MITKVRYANFKALRDTVLHLGRFTLIVGANGTGKSTAIKVLELIKNPRKVTYENIITADILNRPFWEGSREDVRIEVFFGKHSVDLLWQDNFDKDGSGEQVWFQEDGSKLSETSREFILSFVEGFKVYSFDANKIAKPVTVRSNTLLDADGSGLAGVLDQLRDSYPEKFEELNKELINWFPEFDRILFEVPKDGMKELLLRTSNGKQRIQAKDLSDGILLSLAYLTLAYLPNPPQIVAFEEPERGVHPRLLRKIYDAMYRLAYPESFGENRYPVQVVATTHSPYLLDLYKDHPEEIVISSKDEEGVHFERLVDKPHYKDVLENAPLGEIWYSGVLGGVPSQI